MENRRHSSEDGFTLLETMIALAIVVFVFASILMVESASIAAIEKARRMNTVAMLAQQAMTQAEMVFEGKDFREVDKKKAGKFEEPYTEYTWSREIKEVEFPSLIGAGATGTGDAAGGEDGGSTGSNSADMLGKIMTGFLSKAIREVVVTVTWPKGNDTQSFSVSTYWVNLNSDFNLNP